VIDVFHIGDGKLAPQIGAPNAPSWPEEIEEERRLLYVAMTRAKDDLDLIVPQRWYVLATADAQARG
jgi:DNA helicase II / ATP-dependent DNA helicase PcrA